MTVKFLHTYALSTKISGTKISKACLIVGGVMQKLHYLAKLLWIPSDSLTWDAEIKINTYWKLILHSKDVSSQR